MSCTNCIGSDRSRSMIGQHPSTHVCTPQLILVHASKCGNPIGENDGSNTVDARFSGTFFSKSWRSSHTFGRFFRDCDVRLRTPVIRMSFLFEIVSNGAVWFSVFNEMVCHRGPRPKDQDASRVSSFRSPEDLNCSKCSFRQPKIIKK